MVIFLNKGFKHSIAYQLLMYFLVTGSVLFGALLLFFFSISGNFANMAVEGTLSGIAQDMEEAFYVDNQGAIKLDDNEIMLKWGFDALYSNLGYRLIKKETGTVVHRSVPAGLDGALIDAIPMDIPKGFSSLKDGSSGKDVDGYRIILHMSNQEYYFDVVRSDLLGQLANEAVIPAITEITIFAITFAFLIFIVINIIAIRLIVKPVRLLSSKVRQIKPEDLTQRIAVKNLPNELVPVVDALNDALENVEEGFEVQKRFVADAAHELRTPLTVLLNRIELTLEESKTKQRLIRDATFMSRIVEQLLDLSRAQNRGERKLTDVDLVTVTKEVAAMIAPLILETDQNLELITKVRSYHIKMDEGELSVVLKNLIENAIKHSPLNADILITIDNNILIIEDSGPGIAPEFREMIFERFWRANQSDLSGSGLGLAITKEILSHYDAKIVVSKSENLGGAKFMVHFLNC